jgi:hypothetical protein
LSANAPIVRQEHAPENTDLISKIRFIGDRALFEVYAFFNPPPYLPSREFWELEPPRESFEDEIPTSYQTARERVASIADPEKYSVSGPPVKYAFAHLQEYDNPAFREAQARGYFETGLAGRQHNRDSLWCILFLCNEEMHVLYQKEYKSRTREMIMDNDRWLHEFMVKEDEKANREILARHKQAWDGMGAAERAKKIGWGGSPSRYFIAAAGTAVLAGSFFFPLWVTALAIIDFVAITFFVCKKNSII